MKAGPARACCRTNRTKATKGGANAVNNPLAQVAREAKRLISACHGPGHELVTKTFRSADESAPICSDRRLSAIEVHLPFPGERAVEGGGSFPSPRDDTLMASSGNSLYIAAESIDRKVALTLAGSGGRPTSSSEGAAVWPASANDCQKNVAFEEFQPRGATARKGDAFRQLQVIAAKSDILWDYSTAHNPVTLKALPKGENNP
jgi:hypothetical protein